TLVTPKNPVPTTNTAAPGLAAAGAKAITRGSTVKFVALVVVPSDVVTEIGPEVPSSGTTAVMAVGDFTTKSVATPLKRTLETWLNRVPVICTTVPAPPCAGEKPVICDTSSFTIVPVPLASAIVAFTALD